MSKASKVQEAAQRLEKASEEALKTLERMEQRDKELLELLSKPMF